MKHRLLHDSPVPEVFHHDPLQQLRGDGGVPDAFRVHDDDWSAPADAEARGLAALDTSRTEEEPLALQKRRQEVVELSPGAVG
jgi:hypothetical protein